MLKWIRILILVIGGTILASRLLWPPIYVNIGNVKVKYVPYEFVSYKDYIKERTKGWQKIIEDISYLEQPIKTRMTVATNYYNRNIVQDINVKDQPKEIKDKLYGYVVNSAKVIDINTFRDILPEYKELSDDQIKNKMYVKFYNKDMTFEDFSKEFTKNHLSLGPEENKVLVKITGPHYGIIPTINVELLVAQCVGIIAVIVFAYCAISILEKKKWYYAI